MRNMIFPVTLITMVSLILFVFLNLDSEGLLNHPQYYSVPMTVTDVNCIHRECAVRAVSDDGHVRYGTMKTALVVGQPVWMHCDPKRCRLDYVGGIYRVQPYWNE